MRLASRSGFVAAIVLIVGWSAAASADLICYEYDGEGRLRIAVRDDGSRLDYGFTDSGTSITDRNDNREVLEQSTGATASCSTPSGNGGIQSSGGTPSNSPPVVSNENASFQGGQTKTLYVLANDYDPNFHNLTITAVSGYSLGSASIINGGTAISYTASSPSSFEVDAVVYTVSDGHGGSTQGTVTITIAGSGW